MKRVGALKTLKNERGVLTVDFMFAFVIAFGFTAVFFALSLTLSVVEVAQYVSFATARTYAGAHESVNGQTALAQNKFKELMAVPVLKMLFVSSGWFKLETPVLGDFNAEYPQPSDGIDSATFVGARIKFTAKILNLRVPFLGSTASDDTTGVANISTYLMREVTTEECREKFDRVRFQKLKTLTTDGGSYRATPSDSAAVMPDNGC